MGYEFRSSPVRPFAACLADEMLTTSLWVDFRVEMIDGGVLEGRNVQLRACGNECHATVAERLMSRFDIEDGATVSVVHLRPHGASDPSFP
jgi:hypothetical protein